MWVILFVLAIAVLGNGIFTLTTTDTVMHQILGQLSLLSAAVLFSGAAIVEAINRSQRNLESSLEDLLDDIDETLKAGLLEPAEPEQPYAYPGYIVPVSPGPGP